MKNDENKVFVGNLSFKTNEDEVRELFASCGEIVDCVIPLGREDKRPRGFAFVTFETSESAEKAIKDLNGQEFGGRALKVNKAESKSIGGGDRGGRPGGDRGGRSGGGDRGGRSGGGRSDYR